MNARRIALSRVDIRQRKDTPTNSLILQYVGSGRRSLDFDRYIYGYPEGTFFVVSLDDVPFPEEVESLASARGVNVLSLPESPRLQHAVAEALIAGATVDAPQLLEELAMPLTRWQDWDRRQLERKHTIACSRVAEIARLVLVDLKLRAVGLVRPKYAPMPFEAMLGPPPVSYIDALAEPDDCPEPEPVFVPVLQAPTEECEEEEEEPDSEFVPGSQTVVMAEAAVTAAREAELAQRLPGGSRRRLRRMAPGRYIIYGEAMDSRRDLCAAMADARSMGRKGRESAVVDWDGEWPVVVRRYGQGGRTVYKVETALRRSGVEVA